MKTIQARVVDSLNLRLSRSIGLKRGANVNVQITPAKKTIPSDKKIGLLTSLKKIKIKGPVDFSRNVDAFTYGAVNE
jgi:CxxC motif-containing protein